MKCKSVMARETERSCKKVGEKKGRIRKEKGGKRRKRERKGEGKEGKGKRKGEKRGEEPLRRKSENMPGPWIRTPGSKVKDPA